MPGAPLPGSAPNKRTSVLRPDTPLQPSPPDATHATSITRTMTVTEDGAASITLSSAALNRLLFPDAVTSAYTATEALDVIIEGRAVIVSFRATHPADLMVITRGAQYLLRLIPETLPAQTIRLRAPKPESHVTSSYETQLADLIQAGYRRSPPEGFRTERPARPLPPTGALAWYLTLQHRGHRLTIQEYAVANTGALPHPTDPTQLARLFPNARALSSEPLLLQPGAWGRVLVIVDTDTLEPPEPSR